MFYKGKIDRIFELTKINKEEDLLNDKVEDLAQYKNNIELEKGDLFSMIMGAYYAFLPLFIILFIILYLARPWQIKMTFPHQGEVIFFKSIAIYLYIGYNKVS